LIRRTKGTDEVVFLVDRLLDAGFIDKDKIIQKIMEELGTPRPTVRRIIRDMRSEMERKIKILQSEIPLPSNFSDLSESK